MLFSTGSNSGKTFCGGEEGKRHFHLLKSEKRQKGSLGQSVSTNAQDQLGKILTEDPVGKHCIKHSLE